MPIDDPRLLTFSSLQELDGGRMARVLARHLQRIAADCYDRPADDKPRVVTLEFSAVPVRDHETCECETVKLVIQARSKVPAQRSKPYEMSITSSGLAYNPGSPEVYHQATLDLPPDDLSDQS
jgi:hypothetical protein